MSGGILGLFLFFASCEGFDHIIQLLGYNDAIIAILKPKNHQENQSLQFLPITIIQVVNLIDKTLILQDYLLILLY